jgi:hypothetical protein
MDAVRKVTVVEEDGKVTLIGLPYKKGDHVEIILLKEQSSAPKRGITARELLASPVVGMWADREDIGDSSEFARRLRENAEMRGDRE